MKHKATPFAPAPQVLMHECGCVARTSNLGSPYYRPALRSVPRGIQSPPAPLAAGCPVGIILSGHSGLVAALAPSGVLCAAVRESIAGVRMLPQQMFP